MKKLHFLLAIPFLITACVPNGIKETITFKNPDIKDEFCGVHINFQYCKCAFHGDFCGNIGLEKSAANSYVQTEYQKWVDQKLQDFIDACIAANGISEGEKCIYCKDGYTKSNNQCIEAEKAKNEFKADGPLNNECQIKEDEFDQGWKKYSDIDERIPFEERSFEAKQALTSYDAMIDLMIEGFELERDMEIENQAIAELQDYKEALVKDLKTNLLKAFWRLSWITYKTIDGGKGLGESYSTVLEKGASIESLGAGLKVVQGVIPGDSSLAIDTSSLSGKAISVGAGTALEAIDTLGDPVKVATEVFKGIANAPLPSADLTPEEINILKEQNIENGLLDSIIKSRQEANETRMARIAEIEIDIQELQKEIDLFEQDEKNRVRLLLEESCKDLKKEFDQKN